MSDGPEPPLWQQHHVIWTAFGIAVATALIYILCAIVVGQNSEVGLADNYGAQFPLFERRLARSVATCLPAAGLLGAGMATLILRNKLYGASLLIVTGTAMFAILGFFSLPLIPLALWLIHRLRRKSWEGSRIAIGMAPPIHLFIGMMVFSALIEFRPSSLHDKIGVAAAFSLLGSDCMIVALIGHLYRTRRMADFDLGFRISLSTLMTIVLGLAAYVTVLVHFFR